MRESLQIIRIVHGQGLDVNGPRQGASYAKRPREITHSPFAAESGELFKLDSEIFYSGDVIESSELVESGEPITAGMLRKIAQPEFIESTHVNPDTGKEWEVVEQVPGNDELLCKYEKLEVASARIESRGDSATLVLTVNARGARFTPARGVYGWGDELLLIQKRFLDDHQITSVQVEVISDDLEPGELMYRHDHYTLRWPQPLR